MFVIKFRLDHSRLGSYTAPSSPPPLFGSSCLTSDEFRSRFFFYFFLSFFGMIVWNACHLKLGTRRFFFFFWKIDKIQNGGLKIINGLSQWRLDIRRFSGLFLTKLKSKLTNSKWWTENTKIGLVALNWVFGGFLGRW